MAIGSAPEIGVTFTLFGEMDRAQQDAWFEWLRTAPPVGTIVQVPRRELISERNAETELENDVYS